MKIYSKPLTVLSGIPLVKAFEELDIEVTLIDELLTPVSVLSFSNYVEEKMVGYYPTISSHIASLVLNGYQSFLDYVEAFNTEFGGADRFLDVLKSNYNTSPTLTSSITYILQVIVSHRDDFKSFIEVLKQHRPKELCKSVDDITSYLSDSSERFYVAYIANSTPNVERDSIYRLGIDSDIQLSCYDIPKFRTDLADQKYSAMIRETVPVIEEFDFTLAFNTANRKYKFKNQYVSFSVIFDLVDSVLEKWGAV